MLPVALAALALAAPAGTPDSFAFAIGNHTLDGNAAQVGARYDRFDLVIVDGEEASANEIAAIKDSGATVLGYLSVGTIEKWRSWYAELKPYRLKAWQDWKDEWFANTRKQGFRDAIHGIADGLMAKGFDGLFLDNVDMVETRSHRKQRSGMGELVADLDGLVGAKLLFDQNGAPGMLDGYPGQGVDPLYAHFDGWNREDVTFTWDFDHHRYVRVGDRAHEAALDELAAIRDAGLITSATDYVNLNDSDKKCKAVEQAESVDALPYVADIGLTLDAVDANPPACP